MRHPISEIVGMFDNSQSSRSCMYQEYLMQSIIVYHGQHSGWPQVLNSHNQRLDLSMVTGVQITSTFNAGSTKCISCRSVQRFMLLWEQKSHQDVPVNTTVPDSASIRLMVLLIELCKIGSVWYDSWF